MPTPHAVADTSSAASSTNDLRRAWIVILAGVVAALHVGKLPPAVTALQASLGITLIEAGFLISVVQLGGMTLGAGIGAWGDARGPRRSLLGGLAVLALASGLGGLVSADVGGARALLALRALEGVGFLMVVLAAPGLVRRLVPPARLSAMLGVWGAYMSVATASALLLGPLVIALAQWQAWWWLLAGITAAMVVVVARALPAAHPLTGPTSATQAQRPWAVRMRHTISSPGPWLVAAIFAAYTSQWISVIGFLPTLYTQAGWSGAATAWATAMAALINGVGNVAAGRLLQAGVAPARLLITGFITMGLATWLLYSGAPGSVALAYGAVLAFSCVGGLIPATLFTLVMRVAPSEDTLSTTLGWLQQGSAFGQFIGPPLVAWVASWHGGWGLTWAVTGGCSCVGIGLTLWLTQSLPLQRQREAQ